MDAGMAPAHRVVSFCVELVSTQTRTLELVFSETERLQVGEVADGLRDNACVHGLIMPAYDWCLHKHAPSSWFTERLSACRLVRLPMNSGMVPTCGLVSFCVELGQHKHAPVREFLNKLSWIRLVRLPMDSGMMPVRGLVSLCVELHIHRSEANQQTYPIGNSRRE